MHDRVAQIDQLAAEARLGQRSVEQAVGAISVIAEAHERDGRGAHFTAPDVALSLARAAIGAEVVAAAVSRAVADEAVSVREDPAVSLGVALNADPARAGRARQRLCQLRILDPACGAGAFLVAAWWLLVELQQVIDLYQPPAADASRVSPAQLLGCDLDAVAVYACQTVLDLTCGPGAQLQLADAVQPLGAAVNSVDVVVGNPPFVRRRAVDLPSDLASRSSGNLAAAVCERALAVLRPGGQLAMVMPISVAAAASFAPLRQLLDEQCAQVWTSHFDAVPQALFPDAVQRITLLHARRRRRRADPSRCRWHTSRYHRWLAAERAALLDAVHYVPLPADVDCVATIPKLGSWAELRLHQRLAGMPSAERFWRSPPSPAASRVVSEMPAVAEKCNSDDFHNGFYYKRRWSYHLLLIDQPPPIVRADGSTIASELKRIEVDPDVDAHALLALYASTLFAWQFTVMSDCRNLNRRELAAFGIPDLEPAVTVELAGLGRELMRALWASAETRSCRYRGGRTIVNTYFRQAATMPVVDGIDAVLARLYGLSKSEAAAVSSFDRRFRTGR